jgi:hypothetical protein
MTKQITSYKELLQEKARLNALLAEQKLLIKDDWHAIKEDLRPSLLVAATVRRMFTRKASGVFANLGINILADGLIKKVLLSGTGWFTRWVVPFLIKNYASHLVHEPEKLMHKIKHLFSRNSKKHSQETGMEAV